MPIHPKFRDIDNLHIMIFCVLFLIIKHSAYVFFKNIWLFFAFFIQLFVLYLWYIFDSFLIVNTFNRGFQFFTIFPQVNVLGITLSFGIDSFSLVFLLLTVFIFSLSILATTEITKCKNLFYFALFFLEIVLILVFTSLDLFIFYVLFESSLIPMFFIIGFWGSRARRIKAGFYLFLYTMATALLTLVSLLYILLQVGTTFYPDLLNYNFTQSEQLLLWLCLFFTFATKIPIMPFHIWLPEAHVEAPTIGSVILASILLKLGGYGFIRYLLPLFPEATLYYTPFIYTLGISSIAYASITTLRQTDLKRIIAYSSIAHMNMVVLGIFSNNVNGLEGAIYLMLGHGIVSAALFFLIGIIYDRHHTKLIKYYGGLIQVMPLYGIVFLLISLGNIGFPGTSNFVGETLILIGICENNIFIALFTGIGIILSGVYSMWLYNRLFFGTLRIHTNQLYMDITILEFFILSPLIFLMFLIGFNSNFIINNVILNIQQIILMTTF